MEVTKIDETKPTISGKDITTSRNRSKFCVHDDQRICMSPKMRYKICVNCPRIPWSVRNQGLKPFFKYIKAIAISLIAKTNIHFSK
jgi:hypothetical protein